MAPVLLRSGGFAQTTALSEWHALAANTSPIRSSTEAWRQIVHRSPGVLSGFNVTVTVSSAARTYTVRVNGAAGNQTISVGSGSTGQFSDPTNTDAVAAGDLLSYDVSGGSQTLTQLSCIFTPTTGTVQRLSALFAVTISATTNAPVYGQMGAGASDGAITNVQWRVREAANWRNLAVRVRTNTRDGTITVASRLNAGADGALAVSIGAAATGTFEDTADTVAIADNDLANWHITVAGTTGSCMFDSLTSDYVTTTGMSLLGIYGDAGALALNTTRYVMAGGGFSTTGGASLLATEADAQAPIGFACVASRALFRVTTNTITASSTVAFRVGGVSSALAISVPASSSGEFENTADTVSLAATDLIDWQLVTGATGTSFGAVRVVQAYVAVSAAAGGPFPHFLRRTLAGGMQMPRGGMI